MSQPPLSPTPDDLQFETAEVAGAASPAAAIGRHCVMCHRPITSTYYALRDKVLCPPCCARVNAAPPGTPAGRLLAASVMGLGAGLLGALIWFAIRRAAHLEIGLVAVLVGYMVGKAVLKGSGGRGGRGYQILAVVLTYSCIAANYMPDVVQGVMAAAREQRSSASSSAASNSTTQPVSEASDPQSPLGPADPSPRPRMSTGQAAGAVALVLGLVFALSLAAPFLAGVQNIIGLLIIGFALWEAWKLNRFRALPISGPYQMGAGPPQAPGGMLS